MYRILLTSICLPLVFGVISQANAQSNTSPVEPYPIVSAPPPVEPSPAADSPALIARFDNAVELMVQSRFAEAKAEFERIAALSVERQRRASALEFARQSAQRIGTSFAETTNESPDKKSVDDEKDKEEGRSNFLAVTTLTGLNYGWMVPVALDVDDPKAFVGLYLLTAASSFAVPYLLTRDHEITRGMSTMGGAGAGVGLIHGALLYGLLADDFGGSDSEARRLVTASLAGSVLEGTAGYLWAKSHDSSPGQASSIALGAGFGLGYGAATEVLLNKNRSGVRTLMGGMLAGSVGGTLAGYYYDAHRKPTEGDTAIVSLSGVLGLYAGSVPVVVGEVDNPQLIAGALLAGTTIGLFVGDQFTKDVDYSRGESRVIALGSIAGGLVGAGGGFLVSSDDNVGKSVITGGTLGAIVGLLAMIHSVEPSGDSADTSGIRAELTPVLGPKGEPGLGIAGSF